MANCVRYGRCGGAPAWFVAVQCPGDCGAVVILNAPLPGSGRAGGPSIAPLLLFTAPLPRWSKPLQLLTQQPGEREVAPCGTIAATGHSAFIAVGTSMGPDGQRLFPGRGSEGWQLLRTAAFGPFQAVVSPNCAVPSSDGNWLAVCMDAPFVALLPVGSGAAALQQQTSGSARSGPIGTRRSARQQSLRQLPEARLLRFCADGARLPLSCDAYVAPGCQYASFNPDSSLLAVSSDALMLVAVFRPASGERVAVLSHKQYYVTRPSPPLSLAWPSPACPSLLAYSMEHGTLFLTDVLRPHTGRQRVDVWTRRYLIFPDGLGQRRFRHTTPRINGLCALPNGGATMLLATPYCVLELPLLTGWSHANHKAWPPLFRAVVRLLLLASRRCQQASAPAAAPLAPKARTASAPRPPSLLQLWSSLPAGVQDIVFAAAAAPMAAWGDVITTEAQESPSPDFDDPDIHRNFRRRTVVTVK